MLLGGKVSEYDEKTNDKFFHTIWMSQKFIIYMPPSYFGEQGLQNPEELQSVLQVLHFSKC